MDCSTVAQCEDLKIKYSEEQAKRKKLFNEVQEAKGTFSILLIIPLMCFLYFILTSITKRIHVYINFFRKY